MAKLDALELNALHLNWLWLISFAAVGILIVASYNVSRRRRRIRSLVRVLPPAVPPDSLEELIPESRYISIGKAKIHYVQAGEAAGGDIVLLHGIGASVFVWRFLFPVLQARHRVTAFDFLGFGKSSKSSKLKFGLDAQAESIAKALTEIGIDQAMLVGSSMGGSIALWMAKRWPERFSTVVALGPATDSSRVPGVAHHFASTAPLFRHTVNRSTIRTILKYVVANRQLITDDVVDRYLEPFRDRGESLRAFVASTSILSDRRLPHELSSLNSRTLVIWGASDNLVPRRSMIELSKVLTSATFIYHPTGGHHIMEDEPIWLARKLELFLAGDDLDESAGL